MSDPPVWGVPSEDRVTAVYIPLGVVSLGLDEPEPEPHAASSMAMVRAMATGTASQPRGPPGRRAHWSFVAWSTRPPGSSLATPRGGCDGRHNRR